MTRTLKIVIGVSIGGGVAVVALNLVVVVGMRWKYRTAPIHYMVMVPDEV
jgi:hypothetical protein